MKKQIISLSLAAAVAVSFSGCFGGGSLTTPVKKRNQDIDASVMLDVKGEASKSFDNGLTNEKYTNVEKVTLGELKDKNEKLYNLILPIAKEAQKMYKERALPDDITKNGAQWLIGDINTLNITMASTSKGFNGRFSPFNDLLILNFEKNDNENLAKFLIAHEFAHAIALHVSEEKTMQKKLLDGASDAAGIALDIVLDKAYSDMKAKNAKTVKLIDSTVNENVFSMFFTDKDLANETKIVKQEKVVLWLKLL